MTLLHWQCVHCGEVKDAATIPEPGWWCDDGLPPDAGHEWEQVERPKPGDWE